MRFKTIAFAIAALGTAGSASAVNLVKNGGFELLNSNVVSGNYHICDNTKSTCVSTLTDWTATASSAGPKGTSSPGSVLLGGGGGAQWNTNLSGASFGLYGPIPNSPLGGNFIGIDGDANYNQSISQMITGLTIGKIYTLKFYQSAGQQKGLTGATTEQWTVTFGNSTQLSTQMFNKSKGFLPWTLETLYFKANAVSQILTFVAHGTPNGQPPVALLDGVSIDSVLPDPGTWTTMILGFGFIGATARRRRQAAAKA